MNNQMQRVTIIFVHSGKIPPPDCMAQSLAIAYRVAPLSRIVALINDDHVVKIREQIFAYLPSSISIDDSRLQIISIETLGATNFSKEFKDRSKVDREFRGGFWLETANRFMLIADLMAKFNFNNCLHLENDNVLYFDPSEKLEIFRAHARFAVPFDRSRAIPGIVWYQDPAIAKDLAHFMQERSETPDFDVLRLFCDCGLFDAKPLPTMSSDYAKSRKLSEKDYSLGYEEFGGIFDAAAIGQYIGGVDPRNIAGDSRFFVNETSDLAVDQCEVIWCYSKEYRHLVLKMEGEYVNVFSLHAHSKDSLGVSPYNCISIDNENELITGERLQELANRTITSQSVIRFHGVENIRTKSILEIPQNKIGKFFRKKIVDVAPNESWIAECQKSKTIFVYTHLLPYFKKYVSHRLSSPFTLISHNSDDGVRADNLNLLNHPFLLRWFAQNCEFNHEKLSALPIGLTNRQWGEKKYSELISATKEIRKTKLAYANFRMHTHSSRKGLSNIVSEVKKITYSQNLEYEEFLLELAQHKFCLCPRGNGIDTHRFWEAQYLHAIPVIIEADWTPAYSGLPILLLKSWNELKTIDLEKEYIKISSSSHNFDSLKMPYQLL